MSWGVTVVAPQMNEMALKTVNDCVKQRIIHCTLVSRLFLLILDITADKPGQR